MEQSPHEAVVSSFLAWLNATSLGPPRTLGALSVVPVHAPAGTPARYRPFDAALAAGSVTITEKPHATVPTLLIENSGDLPVLLLDGEEVVGGRQNRVLNTSLIVPPKTAFDLPVSCVEHGRWHEARPDFAPGEAMYPALRMMKMAQVRESVETRGVAMSDQGAVWEEIAARHRRVGSHSATGAVRDAYIQNERLLRSAEQDLPCPERAVGVVALVGGRALSADLFDRPETLAHYWRRLVRSYALEAMEGNLAEPDLHSAERLLRRPARAECRAFASAGLGTDVRIRGNGVVGTGLLFEGSPVHTALFRQRGDQRREGGSIRRPSARRSYRV